MLTRPMVSNPETVLDLRGLRCPQPVLRAKAKDMERQFAARLAAAFAAP